MTPMKVAEGPVTLELNGSNGRNLCRIRWRDYHPEYPNGQRVAYVHQLVLIANGEDPHKVFSNGAWQGHHIDGEPLNNSPGNLVLLKEEDHLNHHNKNK